MLGRAVNLPERSILPYTKHLRTFGCEAYVRIPEKDPEFVKARKTKERAREGIFVGTEGLQGHIYVVWVPEKNRLFQSRDVQFREDLHRTSKEPSAAIREKEEETYRAVIRQTDQEKSQEQTEQNRNDTVDFEAEVSTEPAGHRYATPELIVEPENEETDDGGDEIWYPADIDPENGNDQNDQEEPERRSEDEPETSTEKPKGHQSRKGKETEKPTRTSSRINKGQNNDAFAKKHFTTYVSFVAAQIAKQFVPQSLKEALGGPNRDL
jgi:hypothetical protein